MWNVETRQSTSDYYVYTYVIADENDDVKVKFIVEDTPEYFKLLSLCRKYDEEKPVREEIVRTKF